MKELILQNLLNSGKAMVIFVVCYVANICFALYLSISLLKEKWDKTKFLNSLLKACVFIFGMALLVVGITTIPIFAKEVGWQIPEEFTDLFSALIILGIVLYTSAKYLKEALDKFKQILNFTQEDEQSQSYIDLLESAKEKVNNMFEEPEKEDDEIAVVVENEEEEERKDLTFDDFKKLVDIFIE